MTKHKFASPLIALTIFSFSHSWAIDAKDARQAIAIQASVSKDTLTATIEVLFRKALSSDTVYADDGIHSGSYASKLFLFFKSGNIFSKTEKNALVVTCSTDTTYLLRL